MRITIFQSYIAYARNARQLAAGSRLALWINGECYGVYSRLRDAMRRYRSVMRQTYFDSVYKVSAQARKAAVARNNACCWIETITGEFVQWLKARHSFTHSPCVTKKMQQSAFELESTVISDELMRAAESSCLSFFGNDLSDDTLPLVEAQEPSTRLSAIALPLRKLLSYITE